ncbi:MAG: hypothetical protein V4498_03390 [candidate division FCPU426 bacterium]
MRFYRRIFWIFAALHLGVGLWFSFAPQSVKTVLDQFLNTPLIFTQSQGLFLWMMAAGFAYVAEDPEHSVPVVALMTLVKSLLPLFTLVGYFSRELSARHLAFEMTLDLVCLPFLISYFFWFYHRPRPESFVPMIGVFGKKNRSK